MAKNYPVHRTSEAAVGERLRAMFEKLADQPAPPKLLDLVEALEEKRRFQEGRGED